jgi:hypothetical protein
MKIPTLTTSKMPGETEQQYTAWLLYCEVGSLKKTLSLWEKLGQNLGESWAEFAGRLGKKPSDTTLETWSKKYRWVERKDLKLEKKIEEMKQKLDKIKLQKRYKIVIAFGRILDMFIKKLESQHHSASDLSVSDLKKIWEMARTELGESIAKHEFVGIDESKQTPPNEEEKELGRRLNQTVKDFYTEEGRKHYEEGRKSDV